MSTFIYGPTDSVTISPNGDISITDGATTTTYSKGGATKTVTKTPPDPKPPPPEPAVTKKNKPNGDVVHTYTDLSKDPPVTTKITFHPNGDVDILITNGKNQKRIDIDATNGTRDTRTWTEPNPEPATPTTTDKPNPPPPPPAPPAPAAPAVPAPPAPVGSPTGGKKPKKKVRKPPKKPAKKAKRSQKKAKRR